MKRARTSCGHGADGTRTHNLLDATEALSQLSYCPKRGRHCINSDILAGAMRNLRSPLLPSPPYGRIAALQHDLSDQAFEGSA